MKTKSLGLNVQVVRNIWTDRILQYFFCFVSILVVLVPLLIAIVLLYESAPFFQKVSWADFLGTAEWKIFAHQPQYGIWPLVCASTLSTLIALGLSIPVSYALGFLIARVVRRDIAKSLKGLVEILSSTPTIVFGYFAFLMITPGLESLGLPIQRFNLLSPSLVVGIMILPMMITLTDDAICEIPQSVWEAASALGGMSSDLFFRVIPKEIGGALFSIYLLGASRAFGETMILTIAGGLKSQLTLNPLEPAQTLTVFIASVASGDASHENFSFRAIYVCGLILILVAGLINYVSFRLKKKGRAC